MADDDARDERLGALLEVEPLDTLARRKLVTTAVREARPSHTGRWIAAAAAVLVLAAGGAVLLVAPGGHDAHQAATPVRTPAQPKSVVTVPSGAAANSSLAAGSAAALSPQALGTLGDLSVAANRAPLRNAPGPGAFGSTSTNPNAVALVAELTNRGCVASLPAGTITAVATGTLDGARAIAVLITRADGTRVIDVAVGDPCTVRPLP
jgi:hypothetical protein